MYTCHVREHIHTHTCIHMYTSIASSFVILLEFGSLATIHMFTHTHTYYTHVYTSIASSFVILFEFGSSSMCIVLGMADIPRLKWSKIQTPLSVSVIGNVFSPPLILPPSFSLPHSLPLPLPLPLPNYVSI